jgi:hypothetical protein
METEMIYWYLVLFAEFCQWDYFFPILEEYVLTFAPISSADLLVVYFNQYHIRSYHFLEHVSDLFRLPYGLVLDLIYDDKEKLYSKTLLHSAVKTQFQVSTYDDCHEEIIYDDLISSVHCSVCGVRCPYSKIMYRVACCFSRVHEQCTHTLQFGLKCYNCHQNINDIELRKYSVNKRKPKYIPPVLPQDYFDNTHPLSFPPNAIDNDIFQNSIICQLLST